MQASRRDTRAAAGGKRVNPARGHGIALVGALVIVLYALAALVTLLAQSGADNPHALALCAAFMVFAPGFDAACPRLRGRVMRLPHPPLPD